MYLQDLPRTDLLCGTWCYHLSHYLFHCSLTFLVLLKTAVNILIHCKNLTLHQAISGDCIELVSGRARLSLGPNAAGFFCTCTAMHKCRSLPISLHLGYIDLVLVI